MNNRKVIGSAVVAATVGAVAGVAATLLADPKNRRQVSKRVEEMKEKGTRYLHDLTNDLDDQKDMAERKVKQARRKLSQRKGGEK